MIVHWLTESHGLIRTVAKGARRPKSPFAGRLDLFFGGEIQFVRARTGDLHALREVAIEQWREGLRGSYLALRMAGYWCRLLGMALEPEHPEEALYDLLERALRHLEAKGASRRAFLHFENELARLLGVAHESRPSDGTLRDLLGGLPETRAELLEKLSAVPSISSAAEIPAGQNPCE